MKAVVLGGSGLIGKACLDALAGAGFEVVGVSRSTPRQSAHRWVSVDLTRLALAGWQDLLADVDVVVNAAGALQDGARDSLEAVHVGLVQSMLRALADDVRVVQISAAGAVETADTAFFASKARGDAALLAGHANTVVLRPALVIGPEAYGGTALLRAHAGIPFVEFRMFEDARVQTIGVSEVAGAVVMVARGQVPAGTVADLAETEAHSFGDLSRAVRRWQGFPDWRVSVPLPAVLLTVVGRVADGLGWLGWRSPMRTTALRVMAQGVRADTAVWRDIGGEFPSLEQTLARMSSFTQERWFARMFLFLPLVILTLSLFWIASGVIGFMAQDAAMNLLTSRDVSEGFAAFAVLGGSVVDVGLGLAILVRRFCRAAALGMIATSLAYMLGAALIAPDLWGDPLGPMVKVLPSLVLALVPLLFLEDR